ncbi:Lipid phosphate phosphatase gamma-like protein [Drosera capensis]
MSPPPSLKAVTLTHVRYAKGDPLGHFLAWISLIPIFISFAGFLSHFASSSLNSSTTPSNPSSNKPVHPPALSSRSAIPTDGRPIGLNGGVVRVGVLDLGVWGCAVMTMYSRVYLGYHTVGQVCAGAVLGAGLGGAWFWVVDKVLRGWFEVIEESRVGRWLYVKDTSHIEDVMKFECENARAARKVITSVPSDVDLDAPVILELQLALQNHSDSEGVI